MQLFADGQTMKTFLRKKQSPTGWDDKKADTGTLRAFAGRWPIFGTRLVFSKKFSSRLIIARRISMGVLLGVLAYKALVPAQPDHIVDVETDYATLVDLRESLSLSPSAADFANETAARLVKTGESLIMHPADRYEAVRYLHGVTSRPSLFGDDMTTFLALRSAYWQLRHDPKARGSLDAAKLLWEAADRIESMERFWQAQAQKSAPAMP